MDNLNSTEICAIIKVCGESGVSELKIGDFQISFKTTKDIELNPAQDIPLPNQEVDQEENFIDETSFAQAGEKEAKADDLAHMIVEDPVEYERLLAQGDLVEDDDGSTDE